MSVEKVNLIVKLLEKENFKTKPLITKLLEELKSESKSSVKEVYVRVQNGKILKEYEDKTNSKGVNTLENVLSNAFKSDKHSKTGNELKKLLKELRSGKEIKLPYDIIFKKVGK